MRMRAGVVTVNPLRLARDLARFEEHLKRMQDDRHHGSSQALAASYLRLLYRLTELDGDDGAAEIVAESIGVYIAADEGDDPGEVL